MSTPPRELPPLTIQNLETIYKTNFEGRIEGYNKDGTREFNAKIDPQIAEAMARDGWNVKWSKPGQNASPEVVRDFVPEPFIPVKVGFEIKPPTIILIRDGRPTPVGENNVGLLDSIEFKNIDVVLRGVYWQNDSGHGYKAYLKSFYGDVLMDDLDMKYAHLMSGGGSSSSEE